MPFPDKRLKNMKPCSQQGFHYFQVFGAHYPVVSGMPLAKPQFSSKMEQEYGANRFVARETDPIRIMKRLTEKTKVVALR